MIEASDLGKRYGDTVAVDNLSFQVKAGIVTGFLGPNGAGKSTTMRMILGLDRPTSGTATINGKPYRKLGAPLREVGALLDAKAVHGGRSARAHLLTLARSNGISSKRVGEVLDIVGLTGVARKRSRNFSLGMGQRLGIAAALLGDPGVLMFDEPVNGLDPEGIVWIRNLMKEFANEGRTVFVSSHLMSEMALTAEHLIVIGKGRLIADMSTADFVRRSSHNFVRVRSPRIGELATVLENVGGKLTKRPDGALEVTELEMAEIGDLAAEHGLPIHELSAQAASLEAAFMELTGESVEYHGHGAHEIPEPRHREEMAAQ